MISPTAKEDGNPAPLGALLAGEPEAVARIWAGPRWGRWAGIPRSS